MLKTSAAVLALSLSAVPALTQDRPWTDGWSFAVGAASDNRSKDASKSDGEPFAWGQAEWENASGLVYGGPAFETIRSSTGSKLETELSAGLRPTLAGFDLDLNAAHKWQINADPGGDDEAWEFTADASRSLGPASARVRLQHSPDGTGSTEAWTWYAARLGWALTPKLTATAEVGRREQDASVDYTGGNVGLAYAMTETLELDVRYHATDAAERTEQYADQFVVGISAAF